MGRNSANIDYRTDFYKGPSKYYFDKILKTIINFGRLDIEKGLILDFGCGVGHLLKRLKRLNPKCNAVGYDIIPELTEIVDYRHLKPSKIILASVLEHLYIDEIEELLNEFIQMNKEAELLVALPTENIISKILMRLAGQGNSHDDHVSKYKEINKMIEKYFDLRKRKYIFFRMAQISSYYKKQL